MLHGFAHGSVHLDAVAVEPALAADVNALGLRSLDTLTLALRKLPMLARGSVETATLLVLFA
jgi:hypothetical protein